MCSYSIKVSGTKFDACCGNAVPVDFGMRNLTGILAVLAAALTL